MIKKHYFILFVLLFCKLNLFAQDYDEAPAWGGGADQYKFSPGFSLGYVSNSYKIIKNADWRTPFIDPVTNKAVTSQLNSITSSSLPGFSLGFLARYSLTPNVEARFSPSLIFADKQVIYTYTDASQNVTKQIQTTTFDFPLLLKIKSDRVGNYRGYAVGGLKYSLAIGKGNSNDANDVNPLDKQLKNNLGYASYEVGLGCDIYFEYFKLSPEIKLSNSFGNILVQDNTAYSSPLSKLFLHTFTVTLYFE
jgi:hypothetical protein